MNANESTDDDSKLEAFEEEMKAQRKPGLERFGEPIEIILEDDPEFWEEDDDD